MTWGFFQFLPLREITILKSESIINFEESAKNSVFTNKLQGAVGNSALGWPTN